MNKPKKCMHGYYEGFHHILEGKEIIHGQDPSCLPMRRPGCLCEGGEEQPYCSWCLGMDVWATPPAVKEAVEKLYLGDAKIASMPLGKPVFFDIEYEGTVHEKDEKTAQRATLFPEET